MSICVPYNFVKELDWKYVMETTLSGGREGGVGAATFAPQKVWGIIVKFPATQIYILAVQRYAKNPW